MAHGPSNSINPTMTPIISGFATSVLVQSAGHKDRTTISDPQLTRGSLCLLLWVSTRSDKLCSMIRRTDEGPVRYESIIGDGEDDLLLWSASGDAARQADTAINPKPERTNLARLHQGVTLHLDNGDLLVSWCIFPTKLHLCTCRLLAISSNAVRGIW
jgi:hypothetical protein